MFCLIKGRHGGGAGLNHLEEKTERLVERRPIMVGLFYTYPNKFYFPTLLLFVIYFF